MCLDMPGAYESCEAGLCAPDYAHPLNEEKLPENLARVYNPAQYKGVWLHAPRPPRLCIAKYITGGISNGFGIGFDRRSSLSPATPTCGRRACMCMLWQITYGKKSSYARCWVHSHRCYLANSIQTISELFLRATTQGSGT